MFIIEECLRPDVIVPRNLPKKVMFTAIFISIVLFSSITSTGDSTTATELNAGQYYYETYEITPNSMISIILSLSFVNSTLNSSAMLFISPLQPFISYLAQLNFNQTVERFEPPGYRNEYSSKDIRDFLIQKIEVPAFTIDNKAVIGIWNNYSSQSTVTFSFNVIIKEKQNVTVDENEGSPQAQQKYLQLLQRIKFSRIYPFFVYYIFPWMIVLFIGDYTLRSLSKNYKSYLRDEFLEQIRTEEKNDKK